MKLLVINQAMHVKCKIEMSTIECLFNSEKKSEISCNKKSSDIQLV